RRRRTHREGARAAGRRDQGRFRAGDAHAQDRGSKVTRAPRVKPPRVISKFKLAPAGSLAAFAISLSAQTAATNFNAKFSPVPPCTALMTTAQSNQILLERYDPPASGSTLNVGDSLTALVTLFEKRARQTQWLLDFAVVEPEGKELS